MEQKMWFGLLLGWKKNLGRLWAAFSCLRVQNLFLFFWKCCRVRTEKLHNINLRIFFALENMKDRPEIGAINCVLLYWRHLSSRLFYNDFDYSNKICNSGTGTSGDRTSWGSPVRDSKDSLRLDTTHWVFLLQYSCGRFSEVFQQVSRFAIIVCISLWVRWMESVQPPKI